MVELIHKKLKGGEKTLPLVPLTVVDDLYIYYIPAERFPVPVPGSVFALLLAKPQKVGYTTVEFLSKDYKVVRRYFNIAKDITPSEKGLIYMDLERDVVEEQGRVSFLDNYPEGPLGEVAKRVEGQILRDLAEGRVARTSRKAMLALRALFKTLLLSVGVGRLQVSKRRQGRVLYSYGWGVREVELLHTHVMLRKGPYSPIEVLEEEVVIPTSILPVKLPLRHVGGRIYSNHIQHIGKRLIGFTFFKNCVYFKEGKPCAFCEISTQGGLSPEEEVARLSALADGNSFFVITGGFLDMSLEKSWLTLKGYLERIPFQRFRDPTVVYHFPKGKWEEAFSYLKEVGISKAVLPMEVPKAYVKVIIPGKEVSLSYEDRVEELQVAKGYLGGQHVYASYIYGIVPEEELKAEIERAFALGIKVYATLYHTEGVNQIGYRRLNPTAVFHFYKWLAEQHSKRWQGPIIYDDESVSNHPFNAFIPLAQGDVKPLLYSFLSWVSI